ncbi:BON domain-containing protein [Hymenobacter jeollabukensis]|uniref:BON domain-containing protein n=1 Tax=Hymenobacter jeollabukensis TaxID=2025313 RepID=A0A5R8WWT7_9BACT|nr:BON domain-containing protein [Hymenobacter jeollabukensis]TLM96981.1 BON domain-containing protein [Hymenobacter jeollabukensis]
MNHLLDTLSLPPPADAELAAAVHRQYSLKPGVHDTRIQVAVVRGIVRLTGFTDNLLSLERAEELARAVNGVRGVVNELQMRTADLADELLQQRAAALILAECGPHPSVQVTVQHATATLSGVVDSWVVKQWLLRVVKQVVGIWHVQDRLACTGAQGISDADLSLYLDEQLSWDAYLRADGVDVQVQRGRVRLRGAVDSDCTRSRLVATAWAAGATAVDAGQLAVGVWARPPAEPRAPRLRVPDSASEQAIHDAWQLDERLGTDLPALQVVNGVATLNGAVSTVRARRAAEQDARNATGIWHVNNHLRVWPRRLPDDAELLHTLQRAQAHDAYVQALPVEWVVDHGRAILRGTVPGHFEKARLEELAAGTAGVLSVVNGLLVQTHASLPPRPAAPSDYPPALVA